MTKEELCELLEKVRDVINNHYDYHVWYLASYDEEWGPYDRYVTFEVSGHSDQGDGADWTEHWGIDDDGTIHTGDGDTYKNFEEFKYNWW